MNNRDYSSTPPGNILLQLQILSVPLMMEIITLYHESLCKS